MFSNLPKTRIFEFVKASAADPTSPLSRPRSFFSQIFSTTTQQQPQLPEKRRLKVDLNALAVFLNAVFADSIVVLSPTFVAFCTPTSVTKQVITQNVSLKYQDRIEFEDSMLANASLRIDTNLPNNIHETSPQPKKSVDDYELVKVIGRGCMGKVLLSREKETGRLFALKAISKHWVASHGPQEIEHTKAEQKILASLSSINHPFLMKLHCSFQNAENLFLVIDYVGGGDLATQLAQWNRFCETRTMFYGAEMVLGIQELHRLGIIYRDVNTTFLKKNLLTL